jgi:alkylation response protein AidB-like acyl-CoA dehydrogenase
MNFDFSDEQKQLRDEARKFLAEKCSPKAVRVVLDGKAPYDRELWKGLADMGFLGVAIPEEFGGAGAGHLELCVIAEEMGRALAPVPFSSTVYLAAEAILLAGRRAKAEVVAADCLGRSDRHAGAVRGQGQSVAGGNKTRRLRRQSRWCQEAGARRRRR